MRTQPCQEGPNPDLALVERFQEGDESAFDEIVLRYQRMVYGMLRGLVGGHEDADDLAQDVFLRVWQRLPEFEGRSALRTWITRIVINTAINHRESGWVRNRSEAPVDRHLAHRSPGALGVLLRDEEQRALDGAIRKLPDRQRETLRLVVGGGMKYAEIARAMGCTENTVKSNLFHAVRRIREELGLELGHAGRES